MADFDKIMTALGKIMTALGKTITAPGKTMTALDKTMSNLDKTMSNLDKTITNLDKTTTDTDEDRKFELYKQLHEQYAVNDNNKTSSVISFLAAIFSIFVGYGFTFYYDNTGECLVAVTIASQLMLIFLCILCLYFGYSTRRDQFITYKIREKYHVQIPYTNPFERKTNWFNYLPDYYAIMYYGCIFFMLAISIMSYCKLSNMDEEIIKLLIPNSSNNLISNPSNNLLSVFSIEIGVLLIVMLVFTICYKCKYQKFKKKKYNL